MIWARVEFGAKIGVFSRENGRFGNTLIMENIEDTPSYCDTQQHNFEEGLVFAGRGVMGVGAN